MKTPEVALRSAGSPLRDASQSPQGLRFFYAVVDAIRPILNLILPLTRPQAPLQRAKCHPEPAWMMLYSEQMGGWHALEPGTTVPHGFLRLQRLLRW